MTTARQRFRERQINVRKATIMAIGANALQIALMVVIVIVAFAGTASYPVRFSILLAALVVIWGAVLDIRDAQRQQSLLRQIDSMDETIGAMEELNLRLRSQRHDFLNHLQVVYGLMQMKEYDEANSYIEKVYGEITALGQSLKTANAAVNALLQVKLGACDKAGIETQVSITSSWKELPIPGWEMCKILSNLIDNAMDALAAVPQPKLSIELTEDIRSFRFAVGNNGPAIPQDIRDRIFQPGVTTKADGHGMGLTIVKRTLENCGGGISVESEDGCTVFSGFVPKGEKPAEENAAE